MVVIPLDDYRVLYDEDEECQQAIKSMENAENEFEMQNDFI